MLAVLVLCLTLPPAALAESGVAAGSTVSGTVRVYLSSYKRKLYCWKK